MSLKNVSFTLNGTDSRTFVLFVTHVWRQAVSGQVLEGTQIPGGGDDGYLMLTCHRQSDSELRRVARRHPFSLLQDHQCGHFCVFLDCCYLVRLAYRRTVSDEALTGTQIPGGGGDGYLTLCLLYTSDAADDC